MADTLDPNVIPDGKGTGRSSTVRVTTKQYVDSPATPIADDFGVHVASLLKAVGGAVGRIESANKQAGQAAQDAAGAAGRATIEEGGVKAAERDKAVTTGEAMGTRLGSAGDDISPLLVRAAQAQRTMDDIRPQLEQQAAISPLEDPLGWVVAHFTRPPLVQAYNNARGMQVQSQQQIDIKQRQSALQQQIDVAPVGDLIRQAAADRGAAIALEGIQKNKDYLARSAAAKLQAISEEMGMRQASAQMSMAAMRMGVDLLQISQSDKEMEGLQPSLALVNAKRVSAGMPPIDGYRFKLFTPKEKNELIQWGELPNGAYGSSPGQSFLNLDQMGAGPTIGQQDPSVVRAIDQAISSKTALEVEGKLSIGPTANPKFKSAPAVEQRAMVIDGVYSTWEKQRANMLKEGDANLSDDNPYKFRPKDAILVKELQNNMVTKLVAERTARDALMPITSRDIIDMIAAQAQVNMDKPGYVDRLTQDAAEFYRVGSISAYVRGGHMRLGAKNPSDQGYAIAGVDPGNPARVLQTWNQAEWAHLITNKMAATARDARIRSANETIWSNNNPTQAP